MPLGTNFDDLLKEEGTFEITTRKTGTPTILEFSSSKFCKNKKGQSEQSAWPFLRLLGVNTFDVSYVS